jgi:hypothetical protein
VNCRISRDQERFKYFNKFLIWKRASLHPLTAFFAHIRYYRDSVWAVNFIVWNWNSLLSLQVFFNSLLPQHFLLYLVWLKIQHVGTIDLLIRWLCFFSHYILLLFCRFRRIVG